MDFFHRIVVLLLFFFYLHICEANGSIELGLLSKIGVKLGLSTSKNASFLLRKLYILY